jgi:hypothetical protein
MTIEVKQEPTNHPAAAFNVHELELCCFCWKPTPFWARAEEVDENGHANDVACCPPCAETHEPSELPSKEAWCAEAAKR